MITIDISAYKPSDFDVKLRHWYDMVTSRVVAPIICVVATHIDESADQDEVSSKCRDIEEKLKQLEYGELETIRRHMDSLKSLMDKGRREEGGGKEGGRGEGGRRR